MLNSANLNITVYGLTLLPVWTRLNEVIKWANALYKPILT